MTLPSPSELRALADAATPGPWHPEFLHGMEEGRVFSGKMVVAATDGRRCLNYEADARLIALAPELADRLIAAEERAEIAAEEAASLAAANESLLARAETLLWQLEQRADFGARLDDERVAAEKRVAELEEALRGIGREIDADAAYEVRLAVIRGKTRAALRGSSDD